jgi:hypothetical protein
MSTLSARSTSPAPRVLSLFAGFLGALVALAGVAVTVTAPGEVAVAAPMSDAGCLTVHVGPDVGPGKTASYFQLRVAAGDSGAAALLVANPQGYTCRVDLDASYGKTATNSGDTYPVVPAGTCARTSCWLKDLPGEVTLPAHARVSVPFKIAVPVGVSPGEYLAGVLVRPALQPATASPGHAEVGAVIRTSVGIGVAVVVPGPLKPLITIPSVTLEVNGGAPLLEIVEHDGGNTWEHPAGGAVISATGVPPGRFGVSSSTVLPGGSATLTLPVAGAPRGARPTTVTLWYAHNTKKAIWAGVLSYPRSMAAPAGHGATRVVITTTRVPTWVVYVAVLLGAAVLVLVAALAVILRGRRRGHGDDDSGGRHLARS